MVWKVLPPINKKALTASSWYRKIVRVRFQCAALRFGLSGSAHGGACGATMRLPDNCKLTCYRGLSVVSNFFLCLRLQDRLATLSWFVPCCTSRALLAVSKALDTVRPCLYAAGCSLLSGQETEQSGSAARTMLTGCTVIPEAEGAIGHSTFLQGKTGCAFCTWGPRQKRLSTMDYADNRWARRGSLGSFAREDREE